MRSPQPVVGVVASVVVVAVALALAWLLRGGGAVDLPDRLGDLDARDRDDRALAYGSDRFGEAFDGTEVDTRAYVGSDPDGTRWTVTAIAAEAGPLLPDTGFDDPAVSGTAAPRTELLVEPGGADDVQCLLQRADPPRADGDYDAADLAPAVITCQRSAEGRTVRVVAGQSATGGDPSLDATLVVLEDAWDALG